MATEYPFLAPGESALWKEAARLEEAYWARQDREQEEAYEEEIRRLEENEDEI